MNPRQKTDTPTRSASQEFLDRASDEQRDAWATEIDRVRWLMKIHTVKSRETIGAIASNHGLDSYGTLLWLNELVSATEKSGIKPLRDPTGRRIWPGETLLVPNDPVAAKTIIGITESMRRRVESSKRATDIAAGDTRAFREEVSREPFYPKSPLPVGWQDALTAMVMQGQSYRGRHSRILTIDHEHETLCSQMVMSAKSQAVPLRHMDPSDRRFQLSKGKDAWRLPKIEPNYGPLSTENGRDPYNFNGLFDPKLVANPEKASPIPERNREAYAERLDQLSHRLTDTTNPAPIGTQITVHYQRSGSRQKALDASAGLPPEQASYGTHLLVLAAVTDPEHPDPRQRMPIKRFFGWEVPEVDRGRQTPFGSDREGSRHELDRLQSSLREDITRLDRARDAVDAALDPTQNQRVRESLDARKRRVRTELTRPTTGVALDNRGRVDTDFLAYLESLLFASDPKAAYADYLQDTAHGWVEHNGKTIRLKGRWKVDPGSWKWLSEQLGSESIRTQRSIDRIREGLSGTWSVAVLDTRSEPVLARLPEMRDRISRHNANAESVLRLQSEVSRLRSELSNAERDRSDHSDSLRRQIELAESEIDTLVEACIRERIEIVSTTARISAGTESESERRAALPFKTLLQECLPNAFGQWANRTKAVSEFESKFTALLVKFRGNPERARAAYEASAGMPESAGIKNDPEFFVRAMAAYGLESEFRQAASDLSKTASGPITANDPIEKWASDAMLKDPKVASAIAAYRAARSELAKTQQALTARREAMSQPEESIPLSDLIANYAQGIHELDSPFTRESRAEIVRNMPRFAHALKVRVDGRIVEYVDPSTGKLLDEDRMPRVTPSSRIEFFGPAVIDGIHFYQSPSPDLRDKMNPRSEPWAIQMMMGKFRPTSVRAPLPKSSFSPESQARIDATTPAGKLPIIGEWDTRPADVGNEKNPAKRSFGYFLRRKIEEHDRTLIDSMLAERRKARPDTSREDIVDELYELQTTALQLSGYINIFGDVNPGAGQWNQLTFYYDMRTPEARQAIRAANAGFIRSIRAERLERARELAADSDIVRMQVVPGDSPGTLFSRLQTFIALHENKRRFPHLALVHELPAPARTALLRSFLAEGTRLDENELRRLRTEDENRKRARKKQKPIPFTARGERDDSDLDAFFGFAPEGTAIDRPVTPGEWYAIGLDKLDRAIEHLSRDQSGTAMAELPPHQTYLIERMIRSPEAKRSMSVVASIESGSPKEGAPIRRTVKHGAESFWVASSVGIFQHRLGQIRVGWDDPKSAPSWPNRAQLEQAIKAAETELPNIRKFLEIYANGMAATSNGRLESERIRDTLAQDERWFEELRMLVLDRSPAPRERLDRIVKLLESLCRIGDGTPENMLGSALSIPLQEDRRQDVLLHVTGFFREMREDVSQWYRPNGDQVRRVRFNDVANLASNQWEGNFALGITQNYLRRILSAIGMPEADQVLGGSIRRTDVIGELKWSLEYGSVAYGRALSALHRTIESRHAELTPNQRSIISEIAEHARKIDTIHQGYVLESGTPDRRAHHLRQWLDDIGSRSDMGFADRLIARADSVRESMVKNAPGWITFPISKDELPDGPARREYLRAWHALVNETAPIPHLFEPMSQQIRSEAFNFLKRTKHPEFQRGIVSATAERQKAWKGTGAFDPSILPTQDEVSGRGESGETIPFLSDFFGYVRKGQEGMAPGRVIDSAEDVRQILRRGGQEILRYFQGK